MQNKKFEAILRMTQEELYHEIFNKFDGKKTIEYCEGNYILIEGEAPVLLVAHLDTVHQQPVKDIVVKTVSTGKGSEAVEVELSSPEGIGGDDRCGVYGILSIYEKSKVKPYLLFVCNEESGCIGSGTFAKHYEKEHSGEIPEEECIFPKELDDIKFMIEIDRKGKNDSVYYECDNPKFTAWIDSFGFIEDVGSYSDICEIAPVMGKAAVNLSSGYYNPHTVDEYIVEEELNDTIDKVTRIVEEAAKEEVPVYEYMERVWDWNEYKDCWSYQGYNNYFSKWSNDGWSVYHYNDDEWEKQDYHTEQDYKDRCIKLSIGEIDINYFISHDLNSKIWAEYVALTDYEASTELDALRGACGDNGILDEFHRQFGSWREYYEDMCAYYDGSMYC